jgi:DNA transformation protein
LVGAILPQARRAIHIRSHIGYRRTMASDREFADQVVARLLPFGPVAARGMFGGFGVYLDGVMFGLIGWNTLYFKVDDGNRGDFESVGMEPFTYQGKTKPIRMSYYQVPDDVFDDPERLVTWAANAVAAARRAKDAKKPAKRRQAGTNRATGARRA